MADGFVAHPNIQRVMNEDEELLTPPLDLNPTEELIRKKLVHILSMYPGISGSMLQCGIGPSLSPDMWRPVYNQMIAAKQIIESTESAEAPSGRIQSYKHIRLAPGVN